MVYGGECLHDQCVAQEQLAQSIVRSFWLMLHGKPVIHGWASPIRSIALNSGLTLSRIKVWLGIRLM
jgi:hypothetical protein